MHSLYSIHCQKYLLFQFYIIVKVYFFKNLTLFSLVLNSSTKLRNQEIMDRFVTSITNERNAVNDDKIKYLAIKTDEINLNKKTKKKFQKYKYKT